MEESEETTAIVLRVTPFQDAHKIVALFSLETGALSLFCRNGQQATPFLQPFAKVHCTFRPRKSLATLLESTLIERLFSPPTTDPEQGLDAIAAASSMTRWILKTQLQDKPAPKLFALIEKSARALSHAKNPSTIFNAFLLKLLVHEGKFTLKSQCNHCQQRLSDIWYDSGEPFCQTHAPSHALFFTQEEILQLFSLTHLRSLEEIDQWRSTFSFCQKIETLSLQTLA